jgi:hypothetical protein
VRGNYPPQRLVELESMRGRVWVNWGDPNRKMSLWSIHFYRADSFNWSWPPDGPPLQSSDYI